MLNFQCGDWASGVIGGGSKQLRSKYQPIASLRSDTMAKIIAQGFIQGEIVVAPKCRQLKVSVVQQIALAIRLEAYRNRISPNHGYFTSFNMTETPICHTGLVRLRINHSYDSAKLNTGICRLHHKRLGEEWTA